MELLDGTNLTIESVRGDQELANAGSTFVTYEGFVNVTGTDPSGNVIEGFGLVEIEPSPPA